MNEINEHLLVIYVKCKEIIKSNDTGAIVNGAPYHYRCTDITWRKKYSSH